MPLPTIQLSKSLSAPAREPVSFYRPRSRPFTIRRRRRPSPSTGTIRTDRRLPNRPLAPVGGDERARTANLRLAKPALSQLSYVPGLDADSDCRDESSLTSAFGIRNLGVPAIFDGGPNWSRTNDLVLIRDAL